MWNNLIALLAAMGLIVWLFYAIRGNPTAFSRENLTKSFSTLGFLALGLIGFVAICVWLLRVT